jgi:hypothetical protein
MPETAPLITDDYVEGLSPIYRDLFESFWMFNPNGRPEWGIAAQSLHATMYDKYTLGEVREACNELLKHGVLELRDEVFYHPTEIGKAIIHKIQTMKSTTTTPPPFLPPPVA